MVAADIPKPRTFDPEDRLFRHKLRPSWGVGLWIREERKRRRMVFADGAERSFRRGFYHLLVPVDPEKVDVDETFERLRGDAEMHETEAAANTKPPVMTMPEQIEVFKHRFPGGFQGDAFVKAYRHPLAEGKKPRKKHVDAVVQAAAEHLSEEKVTKAIDKGRHAKIHRHAVDILKSTSLVAVKRVRPLEAFDDDQKKAFVESLADLLYGKDRYRGRFSRWVKNLRDIGISASWPLATVLPALVQPTKHVCIKRSVFDLQARAVHARHPVRKKVKARRYRNGRSIARSVRKDLKKAGLEPRDMLDVRAFIWETLRPKGRQIHEEIHDA